MTETGPATAVLDKTDDDDKNIQCDACGIARAAWKITGTSGLILYMCGHHKNSNEAGLSSWASEFTEIT